MGKCVYCGKSAGLFRKKHKECESRNINAQLEVVSNTITIAQHSENMTAEITEMKRKALDNFVQAETFAKLVERGLSMAVDKVLEDGLLSEEEEARLSRFLTEAQTSDIPLNSGEAHQRMVKNSMLRELLQGKLPETRVRASGDLPVLLQKSESLLWLENNVDYFELRSRTHYEGRSSGVSVKIMKGVYYRTGAFKGNPVNVSEMKYIDNGILVLTSKHIYFHSPAKSFKIPFGKLVSLQPFADGISLHRDALTAKPQVFRGIDGWFMFNAVSNLREMQEED